jgi:hypothetical protein
VPLFDDDLHGVVRGTRLFVFVYASRLRHGRAELPSASRKYASWESCCQRVASGVVEKEEKIPTVGEMLEWREGVQLADKGW